MKPPTCNVTGLARRPPVPPATSRSSVPFNNHFTVTRIVALIGIGLPASLTVPVSESVTAYSPGVDVTMPMTLWFVIDPLLWTAMSVREV